MSVSQRMLRSSPNPRLAGTGCAAIACETNLWLRHSSSARASFKSRRPPQSTAALGNGAFGVLARAFERGATKGLWAGTGSKSRAGRRMQGSDMSVRKAWKSPCSLVMRRSSSNPGFLFRFPCNILGAEST